MAKPKIVLGIWIDQDFKDKFKVYCAKNKLVMGDVIQEALEEIMKRKIK